MDGHVIDRHYMRNGGRAQAGESRAAFCIEPVDFAKDIVRVQDNTGHAGLPRSTVHYFTIRRRLKDAMENFQRGILAHPLTHNSR